MHEEKQELKKTVEDLKKRVEVLEKALRHPQPLPPGNYSPPERPHTTTIREGFSYDC